MADSVLPSKRFELEEHVVSEEVAGLVLGLLDPEFYGRELRLPTAGQKTAVATPTWNSSPGENFNGYPVRVTMSQNVDNTEQDVSLQLPIRTPSTSLFVARFRSTVRAFVLEDKNVSGGTSQYIVFNKLGTVCLAVQLKANMTSLGEQCYGGSSYYPVQQSTVFGPWSRSALFNTVGPNADATLVPWAGWDDWRSAHGPVLGTGELKKSSQVNTERDYFYCDGSPWAEPGFPAYLPANNARGQNVGRGIRGYICDTTLTTWPDTFYWPLWYTALDIATTDPTYHDGVLNYDEVFYLSSGFIAVVVPPLIATNDPRIIPGPIPFQVNVYRYLSGAEELVCRSPPAQTLTNMAPGEPLFICPVWKRGHYRVEFLLTGGSSTANQDCAFSIIHGSLSEFMGHRMVPKLLTNSQSSLPKDGQSGLVARATFEPASVEDNVAMNFAAPPAPNLYPVQVIAKPPATNVIPPEQTPDQTTITASRINSAICTAVDLSGGGLTASSAATVKLPQTLDWLQILQPNAFADNAPIIPPAYQGTGLKANDYSIPYENLFSQTSKPEERTLNDGRYFSHMPLSGIQDAQFETAVKSCRAGQVRAGLSFNFTELVSFFSFSYTLNEEAAMVTVFQSAPTPVQYTTGTSQLQAIATTYPIDLRIALEFELEYTTLDSWREVKSSFVTWEDLEKAARIISQLPVSAVGNDYLRVLLSRLPSALADQLFHYLDTGISKGIYRVNKRPKLLKR